jgi:alkylhydroperoxidase family enzyme
MNRIIPMPADCSEPAELVAAIRARRGGQLLNLDRVLLRSVPLAQAWNAYLGAVRGALSISPRLRELAICGVAVLNGAEYEFAHHEPEYRRAGGSERAARRLRDFESAADDACSFDESERAVIALTLEMTRHITVTEATWGRVQQCLPEPQFQVEIVAVIATYNMVSRFLQACGIEREAAPQGAPLL